MDDLNKMINQKQFKNVFQPLFCLKTWEEFGFESFIRCGLPPEKIFQIAREKKQLYEMDTTAIYHAVETFYLSGRLGILFVNVFPSTLIHDSFMEFIKTLTTHFPIPHWKIVFEINEAEEIEDIRALCDVTFLLRERGFTIAIDDYGKKGTSLKALLELEPEYLKLDRYFSENLHTSHQKQHFIETIVGYCEDRIKIILEGIERAEDLAIAKSLGIPIGQGFLLGEPEDISYIEQKKS